MPLFTMELRWEAYFNTDLHLSDFTLGRIGKGIGQIRAACTVSLLCPLAAIASTVSIGRKLSRNLA
jgi:hypothetical protein